MTSCNVINLTCISFSMSGIQWAESRQNGQSARCDMCRQSRCRCRSRRRWRSFPTQHTHTHTDRGEAAQQQRSRRIPTVKRVLLVSACCCCCWSCTSWAKVVFTVAKELGLSITFFATGCGCCCCCCYWDSRQSMQVFGKAFQLTGQWSFLNLKNLTLDAARLVAEFQTFSDFCRRMLRNFM